MTKIQIELPEATAIAACEAVRAERKKRARDS